MPTAGPSGSMCAVRRHVPVMRVGRQRQRKRETTVRLGAPGDAARDDAVRTGQRQRHRNVEGDGGVIAHERREVDCLSAAVDAALRGEEGVHRAGCRAPLHTAIRQFKGTGKEVHEGVVPRAVARCHDGRCQRALVAPVGHEAGVAVGIRAGRGKDGVVAGQELEGHAGPWRGIGKRAHEDVHRAAGGEGREAEVGDHEPLRGESRVTVRAFLWRGRKHIDAGLGRRDGAVHGEKRRHLLIQHALDRHRALPGERAAVLGDGLDVVSRELALELAAAHNLGEVPVTDPVELQSEGVCVDGRDGHAVRRGGQHVTVALEPGSGRAIAHVHAEPGCRAQPFANGGGKPLPQRDVVTRPVFEAFDAELPVLHRHRRPVEVGNRDKPLEVRGVSRKRLRKLHAHTRASRLGVNGIVEDAEAVFRAQPCQARLLRAVVGERKACPRCLDGGAEQPLPFERCGDHRKRIGLRASGCGIRQAEIPRRRREPGCFSSVAPAVIVGGKQASGEAEPRIRSVRCNGPRCCWGDEADGFVRAACCCGEASQPVRFRHDVRRKKGEIRKVERLGRRLFHDDCRCGAVVGHPLARFALQETPVDAAVVGESAAAIIRETLPAAFCEGHVAQRCVVRARQVGVGKGLERAFGRCLSDRRQNKNSGGSDGPENATGQAAACGHDALSDFGYSNPTARPVKHPGQPHVIRRTLTGRIGACRAASCTARPPSGA